MDSIYKIIYTISAQALSPTIKDKLNGINLPSTRIKNIYWFELS